MGKTAEVCVRPSTFTGHGGGKHALAVVVHLDHLEARVLQLLVRLAFISEAVPSSRNRPLE